MGIADLVQTIKNPLSRAVANKVRGDDFPDGFEIYEFVNGSPTAPIQLMGNLMPFQPFEWSGEQRLIKEYYPGNPEAAVQVLGSKEGTLTIKGRFKDKKYDPATVAYGTSYQFTLLVDELRQRGNLLKFGLCGPGCNWYRYGFLENVSFKMNKLSWVDYEMTFFVVSDTKPVNNYFAEDQKTAPSQVNDSMIEAALNFQETYFGNMPASMPQSIADKLNNLISGVAGAIGLVTGFVSTILSTAQEIESSINRALGLIKNARTTLANFRSQIDDISHTFNNFSAQGLQSGKASDTFANIGAIYETGRASITLSQYLAQMQAQFEQISVSVPKARYLVKAGDTLQNISVKFYGVADNWANIYDHNQLTSTVLVAGAVLEIPKE